MSIPEEVHTNTAIIIKYHVKCHMEFKKESFLLLKKVTFYLWAFFPNLRYNSRFTRDLCGKKEMT